MSVPKAGKAVTSGADRRTTANAQEEYAESQGPPEARSDVWADDCSASISPPPHPDNAAPVVELDHDAVVGAFDRVGRGATAAERGEDRPQRRRLTTKTD